MQISQKGIDFIKREEGERLTAYLDSVGIWTIGVGHTGFIDGKPVIKGMRISAEKSHSVLVADLKRFESAVNSAVKIKLTQNQFDALVSLAFNIGEGAFLRSTLVKKLNAGDIQGAADQFLVWKNAGGRPILLNRRKREREVFNDHA